MANKTVVGRLGGVPELRAAGNAHVAVFRLAETKRKYDREQGKWVDDFTIWHDCETWSNPEAVTRLASGTLVIVEGEEIDASYTSKDTGKTVQKVRLKARTVGTVVRDAPQQQPQGDSWGSSSGGGWGSSPSSEEPF